MSLFTPAQLGALDSRYRGDTNGATIFRSVVFTAGITTAPASMPLPSNPSGSVLLLFVSPANAISTLDASVRGRIIQVAAIPEAGSVLAFYVTGDSA